MDKRLDVLMRMQQGISLDSNLRRIGSRTEVLIEEVHSDYALARSYAEAADVDGLIRVELNGEIYHPGDYVTIEITGADIYDLKGKPVK